MLNSNLLIADEFDSSSDLLNENKLVAEKIFRFNLDKSVNKIHIYLDKNVYLYQI